MPMMRRGPLDRYSPEWVLRQAHAHQVEGSIEFHTSHPATFYLDAGRIYAAEAGVDLVEGGDHDLIPDEAETRQRVVHLLAQVMGADGGWYFHDPLGQHPGRGSWVWETATLLMDTRAKAHEVNALATWAERTVSLDDTRSDTITLSRDAWAVVVQLAASASSTDLRTRLGWQPDRLTAALDEMERRGVLDAEPRWRPPAPVTSGSAFSSTSAAAGPPPPVVWGPGDGHHTGPLAPPPVLPEQRTKRRKLTGRKSAGS